MDEIVLFTFYFLFFSLSFLSSQISFSPSHRQIPLPFFFLNHLTTQTALCLILLTSMSHSPNLSLTDDTSHKQKNQVPKFQLFSCFWSRLSFQLWFFTGGAKATVEKRQTRLWSRSASASPPHHQHRSTHFTFLLSALSFSSSSYKFMIDFALFTDLLRSREGEAVV